MAEAKQFKGHWLGQMIASKHSSRKVVVGFVLVVFITSLHRYPIASHKRLWFKLHSLPKRWRFV
jgi:hypothetical protein